MSAPAERPSRGRGTGAADRSAGWYEREVPGIVAGLAESGRLDGRTVDAARTLIAQGRARAALELVIGAVDGT